MVSVKQKSKLGSLAISALAEKGFTGPPCDLSDLEVDVNRLGNSIHVYFYDMGCLINEKNSLYQEMNSLLGDYNQKQGKGK